MIENEMTILFATNFSENCNEAFQASLKLARTYKAKLILLHVLENDIPQFVEAQIKDAMGEEKWIELQNRHHDDARQILIGKMSPEKMAKSVLLEYCNDFGLNKDNCEIKKYDTIVSKGDIATTIVEEAKKFGCQLIVLGSKKGFSQKKSIGRIVKGVMRETKIPVLFVPHGVK
ncbi:MAG TPA: hypothetical protein DCY12_10365 [Candidatus Atribacteria bacterium]|nr:hypothetical protein [Candidatus Atribacteria bacterium]